MQLVTILKQTDAIHTVKYQMVVQQLHHMMHGSDTSGLILLEKRKKKHDNHGAFGCGKLLLFS